MTWCEHCRDHYPEEHYDEEGDHRVGPEWGPVGEPVMTDAHAEAARGYARDRLVHTRREWADRQLYLDWLRDSLPESELQGAVAVATELHRQAQPGSR